MLIQLCHRAYRTCQFTGSLPAALETFWNTCCSGELHQPIRERTLSERARNIISASSRHHEAPQHFNIIPLCYMRVLSMPTLVLYNR